MTSYAPTPAEPEEPWTLELVLGEAEPVVTQGVLQRVVCDHLVDWFEENASIHQTGDPRMETTPGFQHVVTLPPPPNVLPLLRGLALLTAGETHMPIDPDFSQINIVRYLPGGQQGWHYDANVLPGDNISSQRTCSYTLMLNEEYEGGELEFPDGYVPLNTGDLASFTARTRHRVCEVTAGARYVVVAFLGLNWL